MLPTVVITRPKAQGASFAAALEEAHGKPLSILIAPLMEIVPVTPTPPIGTADHLIFTSANGVVQAERLCLPKSAVAWCVGKKTEAVARERGYNTRVAEGDNAALLELLLTERPNGRLLHLHGAHVAGNLVSDLQAAGLACEGIAIYDQPLMPPSKALLAALKGADPLVVPLFSPRSAKLFSDISVIAAPLSLIAISDSVAAVAQTVPHERLIVAENPSRAALVRATLAAIGSFLPPKTP